MCLRGGTRWEVPRWCVERAISYEDGLGTGLFVGTIFEDGLLLSAEFCGLLLI